MTASAALVVMPLLLNLRYFTGQKVPGDRALVYLVTATSPTPRTLKFSKFTKSIGKLFYQYFTYYELPPPVNSNPGAGNHEPGVFLRTVYHADLMSII